jgi:hemerythrin-like domain-containing protein
MTRSSSPLREERRYFLVSVGSTLGLTLACGAAASGANAPSAAAGSTNEDVEVTPGEDLMQEHGVLERILLIYDEAARRIDAGETLDLTTVTRAANIVRQFVADYHEKLEEQFVFPRLERARQQEDLVGVLLQQHRRGRDLTDEIIRRASAAADSDLANRLRSFVRMYRPHAAREETVLFPAFRSVVGRHGYQELGEALEDQEHELFGKHGFEDFVTRVAEIEGVLGIHDLATFTPS